jgi:hypothetical protein
MIIRSESKRKRASRFSTAAVATVLLAVGSVIVALNQGAAHAVHPPAAGPLTPGQRAAALPGEWRPTGSDASVPSASDVFSGSATTGLGDAPPTF